MPQNLPLQDLAPYYTLQQPGIGAKLAFWVSTSYRATNVSMGNWAAWSKVAEGLYLGHLPQEGDIQYIKKFVQKDGRTLAAVFSVCTLSEIAGIGYLKTQVVWPEDWEKQGIKHHLLPIVDFTAEVSNQAAIEEVLAIRRTLKDNDKAVFVHCKNGRARSVMICLIYLYFYGDTKADLQPKQEGETVDVCILRIVAHLKTQRGNIDPADKLTKAKEIIQIMAPLVEQQEQEMKSKKPHEGSSNPTIQKSKEEESQKKDLKDRLKECLCSLQLKNIIPEFASFKMIGIYALVTENDKGGKCFRANHIREYFDSIYKANDENWYLNLMRLNLKGELVEDKKNPLYCLIMADPFLADKIDKKYRMGLVSTFKDELNTHLATALGCTQKEIEEAAQTLLNEVNQPKFKPTDIPQPH